MYNRFSAFHVHETKMQSLKSIPSEFMVKRGSLVKWVALFAKQASKECLFLGGRFSAQLNEIISLHSIAME
jgi:hypothetical protein